MTDKISLLNQYPAQNSPALPKQPSLLPMGQMPPDQAQFSTTANSTNEKSSITSKISSFFKNSVLNVHKFVNKMLGKKEKPGIVSYFDGNPDKALNFLMDGIKAQSPEDLDKLAMSAAASTAENKQLAQELHDVEVLPGRAEIEKILAGGQDKPMQNVENTVSESLKKSQERRENL